MHIHRRDNFEIAKQTLSTILVQFFQNVAGYYGRRAKPSRIRRLIKLSLEESSLFRTENNLLIFFKQLNMLNLSISKPLSTLILSSSENLLV